MHANGVSNRESEVNSKAQFKQWQPTVLAFVFLLLPRFVRGFLDAILWSAHEI